VVPKWQAVYRRRFAADGVRDFRIKFLDVRIQAVRVHAEIITAPRKRHGRDDVPTDNNDQITTYAEMATANRAPDNGHTLTVAFRVNVYNKTPVRRRGRGIDVRDAGNLLSDGR